MRKQELFIGGAVTFFLISLYEALLFLLVADTCPRPAGCLFSNLDCGMDPGSAGIAFVLQDFFCPLDLTFWGGLITIPLFLAIICAIAYHKWEKN